jgi:two-component system LytT family response regulator
MISAVAVDDEMESIDALKGLINAYAPEVRIVGHACSVQKGYELIKEIKPQLVFLDIEMGVNSGFDLLELLDDTNFYLVFITAHEKFALRAIRFSALDYLLKPIVPQELKRVVNKITDVQYKNQEGQKVKHMFNNLLKEDIHQHRLTIPTQEGFEFIKIEDILYCKADGSYSHLILKDGQKRTTSKNLKYYSERLEDYGFYRIHSASLVNLKYVAKYSKAFGGGIIMEDGSELSVSKSRKAGLLALLNFS